MLKHQRFATVVTGTLAFTALASAHVVLDVQEAHVGSGYKAVFKVSHGCKGSATTKIAVRIPAGFIGVKPEPKSGWQIDIERGAYDHPYESYHRSLTEGAKTITWTGGPLPDQYYDEFTMVGLLDKSLPAGATMYFPVVQTCEQGVQRWIEIPAEGQDLHSLEQPAAALKLLPAAEHSH